MVDGNGLEKPALHFCGDAAQWKVERLMELI
jgi:hypothetical protein